MASLGQAKRCRQAFPARAALHLGFGVGSDLEAGADFDDGGGIPGHVQPPKFLWAFAVRQFRSGMARSGCVVYCPFNVPLRPSSVKAPSPRIGQMR